ncbi:MAG: LLM class flavin-dependent oxidoreductase [Rhizobacter sp.]
MASDFHWLLPTEGDARGLDPDDPTARPAHWVAVARAAELAGFQGLQVPGGAGRPDAWVVASLLARHARRLKFLLALRPGFVAPAAAAQAVASLQQLTGNRVLLTVLAGGDLAEHRAHGDLVNHDDRFARAAEFLAVVKQVWRGRPGGIGFRHEGAFYRIHQGGLVRPLRSPPPIHLGGVSPASIRVAAEHADVHVQWADTPEQFGEQVRRVQALAAGFGRTLRVSCRTHVIAAPTEALAWTAAQRQLDRFAPGAPAARTLEVSPNVWRGFGHVRRPGTVRTGTALVGSYRQIAARLEAFRRLGADGFVLSGDRGLEDLLQLGEEVLPRVRERGADVPDEVDEATA